MITTIHHDLPVNVSKQILKSLIGSINATVIAYARGHIRFGSAERILNTVDADSVPTIDDFNDAMALENEKIEGAKASEGMGFTSQMPNDELCERLMVMRNYLAGCLNNLANAPGQMKNPNDVPLSIAETIKFQVERSQDMNAELIEALAIAVDIDPDMLKAAKLKMIEDDRADLKANGGKVLTFLSGFRGEYHEADEVEELFNGCPAHVQYKLVAAGVRSHERASEKALAALLRGRLDAAGDIKMIKASKADLILWLQSFTVLNKPALDAYIERGGSLPAFDNHTIVSSNYETQIKQTKADAIWLNTESEAAHSLKRDPLTPVVDEVEAPASQDKLIELSKSKLAQDKEPKVIGKPKRAKRTPAQASV